MAVGIGGCGRRDWRPAADNRSSVNFPTATNISYRPALHTAGTEVEAASDSEWAAALETLDSERVWQLERRVSVLRRIGPQFLKTFPPRVPSCLTAPQRALTGGRLSSSCRA